MKRILTILLVCWSFDGLALDNAVDLLKSEEGFSSTIYLDTEGYPTFGYGFKITSPLMGDRILEVDANRLLIQKVIAIHERLSSNPTYLALPKHKRHILISMAYQMGHHGLMQFRNMWAALEIGDYENAGEAMKDSLWYKQTPNRAERHIDVIEGY